MPTCAAFAMPCAQSTHFRVTARAPINPIHVQNPLCVELIYTCNSEAKHTLLARSGEIVYYISKNNVFVTILNNLDRRRPMYAVCSDD